MPRITSVATRTGDDGTTGLGDGTRVDKDDQRIEAYGSVDELSSSLGVALSSRPSPEVHGLLLAVQNDLFHLGADLCVPEAAQRLRQGPRIEDRHLAAVDEALARLSEDLDPLANFVLPGGTPAAAALHVARTVCRRAERRVLTLSRAVPVNAIAGRYLNRLSDLLFVAARYENKSAGAEDVLWDSRR